MLKEQHRFLFLHFRILANKQVRYIQTIQRDLQPQSILAICYKTKELVNISHIRGKVTFLLEMRTSTKKKKRNRQTSQETIIRRKSNISMRTKGSSTRVCLAYRRGLATRKMVEKTNLRTSPSSGICQCWTRRSGRKG